MSEIRKFSLVYDAREDRIAWDAEDQDGATTRLWLTQRMCRALVGAILPLLQSATAPALEPLRQSAVQSWEQAAAVAGLGKVPGVRLRPGAVVGLVHAARMRRGAQGLSLTFDFTPAGSRTVTLSLTAVRQMLTVLCRLYGTAGWPADLWPPWIADPDAASGADALN
ncbi:MAG: hypothetical protein P4L73_07950 [Caulobacteraceae bacterium]|nr:hypothetical protein [Caulobacteraceae bacterium]